MREEAGRASGTGWGGKRWSEGWALGEGAEQGQDLGAEHPEEESQHLWQEPTTDQGQMSRNLPCQ